jgi:hypothetical protein
VTLPASAQVSADFAARAASFGLERMLATTLLIVGAVVARSMVASVEATIDAPHGPEVERIQSNLMALFAAR